MTAITKIAASWTIVALVSVVCVLATLGAARPTVVSASSAPTSAVVSVGAVTPDDTPWG